MTEWSHKKILVPIDFSEESWSALDAALSMLDEGGEIIALHVLQEGFPVEYGEMYHTVSAESRKEHVRSAFQERMSDIKYKPVRTAVVIEEPAHGIAAYAEQEGVDLIVMPSHGRTGIKRLLIGSVAERVVRMAPCAVLVLRAKQG